MSGRGKDRNVGRGQNEGEAKTRAGINLGPGENEGGDEAIGGMSEQERRNRAWWGVSKEIEGIKAKQSAMSSEIDANDAQLKRLEAYLQAFEPGPLKPTAGDDVQVIDLPVTLQYASHQSIVARAVLNAIWPNSQHTKTNFSWRTRIAEHLTQLFDETGTPTIEITIDNRRLRVRWNG